MEENIKKEYELAVLVDSETAEAEIEKLLSVAVEAEILVKSPVELINLAYSIKKQNSATLLVYQLSIAPNKIDQLKKELSFQPRVLRFLLTVPLAKNDRRQKTDSFKKPAAVTDNVGISSNELLAKTLEKLEN
ncbi:MAG: 30S ribosomal protein S6 [Patescibacteria group bacterium]